IAASVAEHPDMNLVTSPCVLATELEAVFESIDRSTCCALVLVGYPTETDELAQHWLEERDNRSNSASSISKSIPE
ncbi:MAG TPA: hypothetical protein VFU48_03535, partial [Nitrospira sp.]|nr:hypothetical protein [Nitrospira sp.]